MSNLTNSSDWLSTGETTWRLDHPSSTFELTVKPRSGPVHVAGSLRLVDSLLRIDSNGEIQITATIDTSSVEIEGERYDPRLRFPAFPDVKRNAAVRFKSTRVIEQGAGRLRVIGELAAGVKCVPVEFTARVKNTNGSLEIDATMAVNHRRLGMPWLPGGPLKAPSELVVRADLSPTEGHVPSATTAVPRRRRPRPINSRYHLMASRAAHATGN